MENRRTFLKKGVALAAGSFLMGSQMSWAQNKVDVGVQLYTVRNQIDTNMKQTLEQVAAVGYNQVELANHKNGKFYGWPPRKFRKFLNDQTPVASKPITKSWTKIDIIMKRNRTKCHT